MSSLLLYSTPKWVFRLAYLAVPVNVFNSLYGICLPSFYNFFAKPKSTIYILFYLSSRYSFMYFSFNLFLSKSYQVLYHGAEFLLSERIPHVLESEEQSLLQSLRRIFFSLL